MTDKTAIHYDCDPGQDDVIALMYALGSDKVEVKSISIVGGNANVQQCAQNAQQILDLCGYPEIPVYIGAAQPLKRILHSLPEVFGESGMDGAGDLPPPSKEPTSQNAVSFMIEDDLPRTWVATGPLTNLALAFQKDPTLSSRIDRLVIMGGCTHPEHIHGHLGNFQVPGTDGWAEYNFAVDPEGAKIVFQSGIKDIAIIGVNITRTVLFNHEVKKTLRINGNRASIVAANIMATVGPEDHIDYASCKAFLEDPVRGMHDVVAMAYLCDSDLFVTEQFPIEIVTDSMPSVAGQTHINSDTPDHPSVRVVMDIDRKRFLKKLTQYLGKLP